MPRFSIVGIVNGEVDSPRIYEDDYVLAVPGWKPVSEGHVLVIPKESAASLGQLSDESAAALGRVLPRLCRAVVNATGVETYNILQNNGKVAYQNGFHVHFHIIPKRHEDDGVVIEQRPREELSMEAQQALADQVRAAL